MSQLAEEAQQAVHDRGLLAACDVMVLRALELLGKRIVRVDRSRFGQMGDLAFYEAHCRWQPDADMLDRALGSAWEFVAQVVENHAAPGISSREVSLVLDRYVRDLVKGMRVHQLEELEYRLGAFT